MQYQDYSFHFVCFVESLECFSFENLDLCNHIYERKQKIKLTIKMFLDWCSKFHSFRIRLNKSNIDASSSESSEINAYFLKCYSSTKFYTET